MAKNHPAVVGFPLISGPISCPDRSPGGVGDASLHRRLRGRLQSDPTALAKKNMGLSSSESGGIYEGLMMVFMMINDGDDIVIHSILWRCPEMRVSTSWMGLFHGKSHRNMDDLRVPAFQETSIW